MWYWLELKCWGELDADQSIEWISVVSAWGRLFVSSLMKLPEEDVIDRFEISLDQRDRRLLDILW